jgi:Tol biopolymer transport system component
MKRVIIALVVIFSCLFNICGQDMFNSKQLTFSPDQVGFPTWSPDGKYLIYSQISRRNPPDQTGLWRITMDGKDAKQLYNALAEHPRWSPDGRYIVFDADSGKSIRMIPANGGPLIKIVPDSLKIERGAMPCWSPDSKYIAFLEGGTLTFCVADIKTGKVSRIFREEGMVPIPGCWTRDGKSILIVLMDIKSRKSTLWKISVDGMEKEQIAGLNAGIYRYADLSPDGSLLIYAAIEGKYLGLYVMAAGGGKSLPLAVTGNSHNESALWSPDGKHVAFNSSRSGNGGIWIMDLDIEKLKKELSLVNK